MKTLSIVYMKMRKNKDMLKRIKPLGLVLFLFLLVSACKKQEGYGGKSTIYGKVLEKKYNNSGQYENEYYLTDTRVYIIFGNDDFYSDEVRTDYEGKFKFSYLYAGDYTIYTYTECSPIDPCDSGTKEVLITVRVLENGDVVVTDDLVVENW